MSNSLVPVRGAGVARAALIGGAAIALLASSVTAQAASIRENTGEKRLNELEQEVRILRNRVKALESRKAGQPPKRVVTSSNDHIKVRLYGQVNRAVLFALSKRDSQVHNVDNENSQSRFGIRGHGNLGGGWRVGARIEIGLDENNSGQVSDYDDQTRLSSIDLRRVEVWFDNKRLGRLWMGKGPTASDDIANSDLSGTGVITTGAIADMAGGINFHKDGMPTGLLIGDFYDNLDGNSRKNRVRYDTPVFFGFQVRVSYDDEDTMSWGIFYEGNPFNIKAIKLAASFGMVISPGRGATDPTSGNPGNSNTYSGSVSALHVPSGLSVTFSMGTEVSHNKKTIDNKNPWVWYIKLGWTGKPFPIGKTAFSIDFGRGDNFDDSGNRLWTIGIGFVQKIDRAATELYIGYRFHHATTRSYGTLDSIHAIMTGARVKF